MLQTVVSDEPRYVPSIIADKITGVHAAYAIVLALFHRERTGQAQAVSVPMMETIVAFTMQEQLGGAVFEPREGAMGMTRCARPCAGHTAHAMVSCASSPMSMRTGTGSSKSSGGPTLP